MVEPIKEKRKQMVFVEHTIGYRCTYCDQVYGTLNDAENCETMCLSQIQQECEHSMKDCKYYLDDCYGDENENKISLSKYCSNCQKTVNEIEVDLVEDAYLLQKWINIFLEEK